MSAVRDPLRVGRVRQKIAFVDFYINSRIAQ